MPKPVLIFVLTLSIFFYSILFAEEQPVFIEADYSSGCSEKNIKLVSGICPQNRKTKKLREDISRKRIRSFQLKKI